jgi:O-antigen ligase
MNAILLLLILTVVALATLGVLLFKPKLGLYLFLVFAPFSYYYAYLAVDPFAAGSLLQKSTRDLFILALYLIWLFYFLVKKEMRLPVFRASLVAVLFVGLALLQTLRSIELPGYNAFIGLRNAIEFIPLILLVPIFFKKDKFGLENIFKISIVCAILVALLGLYELYLSVVAFKTVNFLLAFDSFRIRSTLFNPNNLGYFQATMLLLLLGMYFRKEYFINKSWSQAACLLLFVSMLTSFSRGAMLGFLIGFAFLLIAANKVRTLMVIGLVSALLVVAVNVCFPLALYRYYSIFEQGTQSHSLQGRMNSANSAAEQIANDPMILLTGMGFDKVGSIVDVSANSGDKESGKWLGQAAVSTDNYYVLLVMAGGLGALLIFLAIIYVLIREAWQVARSAADPFLKGLAGASGAIFVAYFIFGFTVDLWGTFPSNFYFWLLAGLLLAAKRLDRVAA